MRANLWSLLYVEDDPLWQALVRATLAGLPGVGRLEFVENGEAARRLAAERRPDLILLDLGLPDADGLELARELSTRLRAVRVVILSARRDDLVLNAAAGPAVAGLLWKTGTVLEQLPIALQRVMAGGKYFSPEVDAAVHRLREDPHAFFKIFSRRELDILHHVARAETDAEIGARLQLSEHTVRSHRQHIMRKLGLRNAAKLIHWAIMRGFGHGPARG